MTIWTASPSTKRWWPSICGNGAPTATRSATSIAVNAIAWTKESRAARAMKPREPAHSPRPPPPMWRTKTEESEMHPRTTAALTATSQ